MPPRSEGSTKYVGNSFRDHNTGKQQSYIIIMPTRSEGSIKYVGNSFRNQNTGRQQSHITNLYLHVCRVIILIKITIADA